MIEELFRSPHEFPWMKLTNPLWAKPSRLVDEVWQQSKRLY